MASHQTFVTPGQESRFTVQRNSLRSRRDDLTPDRKKEDSIALPPVRALATTSPEKQPDRLITPLNKWQIHRCATPNTSPCQEDLVNEWLHRNHIRVVERLPKMDPIVLTSRGTDVSKYISFIHPPPLSLKLFASSTEEKKYREKRQKQSQASSPVSSLPCPRLLRSQRSDREMFALNPVIRVGGGYRRLSWKVLDVLPSIGQYDPDEPPVYSCASCHATLPVVEKVTNSRGQLRSILTTPKRCHKCGAPTTNSQILTEKDLHESVVDTLHRGDSRFIVDHRRFEEAYAARSSPRNNAGDWHSNTPMDWRDDLESFRIHMSRQSQTEEDLDTGVQGYERNRSESGSSSVFMTEPGANIDSLNEPPDVRRAWDDGTTRAEITREDENDSGDWGKGKENGKYSSDNDLDAYSDFEMIEDYDPKSGFTVRLRRKPFGGAKKTSYFIHGIQDEEGSSKSSLAKGGKLHQRGKEKAPYSKQGIQTNTQHKGTKNKRNKQTFAHKRRSKHTSHDASESEKREENETNQKTKHDRNSPSRTDSFFEERRDNETNQRARHHKNPLTRTDSFFVVGLDQRDRVFTETPVIEEVTDDDDDDDDIVDFSQTRFSEDSLSDFEFHGDAWSPGPPGSGLFRPRMPSPGDLGDQDDMDRSSSLSISPTQHDGYLADSEENADLNSLQAQIQQARSNAKKSQRRKEASQEMKRRESKETTAATRDSPSQRPVEDDAYDRAPLNSGEWDSDWDSDFSLHVQPLSDLSASSSDETHWEPENEKGTNNQDKVERTRKRSDKTITNSTRRKKSKPGNTDHGKGPLNERALEGGARRSIGGEDHPRDRQPKRPIVKPIPKIGQDSDSDDVPYRPRPRAPRGDDELSESDINFFTQQFQAPHPRRDLEKSPSKESPVGCKGINCYRCMAFIPECEGVCAQCGTLCQRPGGACTACRDICQSCGKPRYRCISPGERLEASDEDEEGEDERISEGVETRRTSREQTTPASKRKGDSPVLASEDELAREESLIMIGGELNNADKGIKKSRERKIRAPPERKSKDLNSVKRVRKKRNTTTTVDDEDNEPYQDKEVIEEEQLDASPESTHPSPVTPEDSAPAHPEPSAFATKATKKMKPSKKVISQTVVYKEKEKAPKSKRKSSRQREEISKDELVVTSPTRLVETVESGEELMADGEGTGEEVRATEKAIEGDDTISDVTKGGNDVSTQREEEGKLGKEEEMEKEKEKEDEEKQKEEQKKAKIRGVSRVNAAFKERAELAKRLQSVLKEAISEVMGQADIKTRKDSTIDYIAQYRLVDRSRLEMYGRAFTLEDEDEDGMISYEQMLLALEGVPSIAGMSRKQLMFVLQVLELFPGSRITFKMFSVATALCERVTILDAFVKQLVEELDLFELECKLDMFRNMFFVTGDYSITYITADQLRIELKAGGLNQNQEDHVIGHILQSSEAGEISFLDYMAYLPLFLSIHQNICENALDMSRNKYQRKSAT